MFCEAALAQRPEANDKALRQTNYQESPKSRKWIVKASNLILAYLGLNEPHFCLIQIEESQETTKSGVSRDHAAHVYFPNYHLNFMKVLIFLLLIMTKQTSKEVINIYGH